MGYLFLSHSSRDDAAASELRRWLKEEQKHESIFLDHHTQDGIVGGEPWEERLYTELRRCRALVALVSPDWLASPWCLAEASHAQALRKRVIALRIGDIDEAAYTRAAPPVLRREQGIPGWPSKDAQQRLKRALEEAGLDPENLFVWTGDREPYPGLAAFEREDAAIYFGREQEITDLLGVLDSCRAPARPRLVLVHGASGTGKSSLVRAGILPRLERDPRRWLVVPPFRPLREPLRELANALTVAAGTALPPRPRDHADGSTDANAWAAWIVAAAEKMRLQAARLDATVLLTIDQLEEALSGADGAGEAFLLALRNALAQADHRLLALATLRADFSGTLQRHPLLREPASAQVDPEIIRTQTFQLGPMPRASFHAVIEGPAALVGLELEYGLASRLVDEARTDDALPLLAFALRELWDSYGKDDLRLTHKEYDTFGGLENAVGDRAAKIFAELEPTASETEAFRTVLLFRMTEVSDSGRILRRRLPLADVPTGAARLVDAFADSRARLFFKSDGFVEVSHEALFRRWDTLADWLEAARDDLRVRQRIEDAFQAWRDEAADSKPSRLLPPGRPLEEARELFAKGEVLSDPELRRFVAASIARAETERRREERNRAEKWRLRAYLCLAAGLLAAVAYPGYMWWSSRAYSRAAQEFAELQVTVGKQANGSHALIFSNQTLDGAWKKLNKHAAPFRPITSLVVASDDGLDKFDLPPEFHDLENLQVTDNTFLDTINLPEHLQNLYELKVSDNPALSILEIPEGYDALQKLAVQNNPQLAELKLPQSLSHLKSLHIQNNANLEMIELPKSLPKLEALQIRNNPKLATISLPDGLTVLSQLAVRDNMNLSTLTLPQSLPKLESLHIQNLPELSEVILPKKLDSLREFTVADNPNLERIDLSNRVAALRALSITNNSSLKTLSGLREAEHLRVMALSGPLLVQTFNDDDLAAMPSNLQYLLLPLDDDEAHGLERRLHKTSDGGRVKIYRAYPRTNEWNNAWSTLLAMAKHQTTHGDKCRGIDTRERTLYTEHRDLESVDSGSAQAVIRYNMRVGFEACEDGDVRPIDHRTCTYYAVDRKIVRTIDVLQNDALTRHATSIIEVRFLPPKHYTGNCNDALDDHFVHVHEEAGIGIDQWMKIFHEDRLLVDEALAGVRHKAAGTISP